MGYWALGHVHTRSVLREASPTVIYPGNPQGRHPNETGPRGVYLVEVNDQDAVCLDFVPVDVVRWEALSLDIASLQTEQAPLDALDRAAEDLLTASNSRPVIVRLALTGRGPLHRWLRQGDAVEDMLANLNDSFTEVHPWLWCDKIEIQTSPPIDRERVLQREDFTGDLMRLAEEMRANPEALAGLQDSLKGLFGDNRARGYLRDFLPQGDELLELLAAAEEDCLASLLDEEE